MKATPLAWPYIYAKGKLVRPHSQNDETAIIKDLLSRFDVPRRFVEFGFSGWEFNCASLAHDWEGLLIDGDQYNVNIARTIFPNRVKSERIWLTLDNLGFIRDYIGNRELGILSIDVDGNDYWFLRELINSKPAILINEYNSTLGLRPLTIPYDPNFNYRNFATWSYYGASLAALAHIAEKHDYALMAVGSRGINAYFVRKDLLTSRDQPLDLETAYYPHTHGSGGSPAEQ